MAWVAPIFGGGWLAGMGKVKGKSHANAAKRQQVVLDVIAASPAIDNVGGLKKFCPSMDVYKGVAARHNIGERTVRRLFAEYKKSGGCIKAVRKTKHKGRPQKHDIEEIKKKLRSTPILHRLTQADAAMAVGLPPSTFKRYLKEGKFNDINGPPVLELGPQAGQGQVDHEQNPQQQVPDVPQLGDGRRKVVDAD